jgi:hypothetical protein
MENTSRMGTISDGRHRRQKKFFPSLGQVAGAAMRRNSVSQLEGFTKENSGIDAGTGATVANLL